MSDARAPGRPGPAAVVGAGSWGTALALHLVGRGSAVRLWARDPVLAEEMGRRRVNARYLPELPLPPELLVAADPARVLTGADLVLVAVPSAFVAGVLDQVAGLVEPAAVVVSGVKGLDPRSGGRISDLLAARLPGRPVVVLSGPSLAREVALGLPAALVAAAADPRAARTVQARLSGPSLRVYTSADVVGVELAGALKNVIAIAAGLGDALGLGENARAALVTRGLAELSRLGRAMGADPRSFAGLAGVGDLVLTCTSEQSRNLSLGRAVGRGRSLAEVEAARRTVAEGPGTVRTALRLAAAHGVELPIAEAVAAVLFEGRAPAAALAALMAREPKAEDGEPSGPTPGQPRGAVVE